jgi:hypothetical protein
MWSYEITENNVKIMRENSGEMSIRKKPTRSHGCMKLRLNK